MPKTAWRVVKGCRFKGGRLLRKSRTREENMRWAIDPGGKSGCPEKRRRKKKHLSVWNKHCLGGTEAGQKRENFVRRKKNENLIRRRGNKRREKCGTKGGNRLTKLKRRLTQERGKGSQREKGWLVLRERAEGIESNRDQSPYLGKIWTPKKANHGQEKGSSQSLGYSAEKVRCNRA